MTRKKSFIKKVTKYFMTRLAKPSPKEVPKESVNAFKNNKLTLKPIPMSMGLIH